MKASAFKLLKRIPGPASEKWPQGERFVQALAHGSMSVEFYAPKERDPQTPHAQDELYFIHSGTAELVVAGQRSACSAGDALFVAAGAAHYFENFSPDFTAWVVFWGPQGGEKVIEE